ncbi:protocatechuate 3,4-dioxygenase [Enemella evansiae]|uniref:Protocatechuate 3,4-dioxygenase n=1 Tax=Enemella evansiae TaxID=2016499 RepID=A0A255GJV0_9ACTN|nr:class III extradiol dioxygenase subunit beta [Enemella evansiae]OYO09275.1 protocatechuate 3,4-dioxygenase [Enemella evansiae]OYO13254.1 protocatechuate 3,4-dioxygenase [Enemella evansiae]
MAELVGGIGCSHVPAVGAAMDNGKTEESYWAPFFEKLPPAREWMAQTAPDVCIVVYNDHATALDLNLIPTFALGVGESFQPADEGYGPRRVPVVEGAPDLAWHLAESLILDEFDMTLANKMEVDHGLTVPLSVMFGQPQAWPTKVIPLCVNVIQYPPPTAHRCLELGRAIRRALDAWEGPERIAIFGTGGMSHQLQGERVGLINSNFDTEFMNRMIAEPDELATISHTELIREAGSEGIEMVMWMIMRGAMNPEVTEIYRNLHVPTSNTSNGLLILENA